MAILPSEIGEIPEEFENHDGLYLPFPAAIENEELQEDLQAVKTYTPQEAAQYVNNGRIPPQGGVIEYPFRINDDIFGNRGAIDLVAAEYRRNRLIIYPTYKDAVDPRTDAIQRQGLVVMFMPPYIFRTLSTAIDRRRAELLGGRAIYNQLGKTATMPIDPFARRDFELEDIDSAGIITAIERRRFF